MSDGGSTLLRERAPKAPTRYDEVLDTVKSLIGFVKDQTGKEGTVGIGLPGAISAKTGRIKNSNNAYLIGTDFVTDVSRKLLQRAYKIHSGLYVSRDEIARVVASQEANAVRCLAEYEDRLARSLTSVINVLDPDAIVLGGSLSKIARSYPSLHSAVARHAFTDRLDTKIVPSLHGDASAVRGAAMLWPPGDTPAA